LGSLDAIIGGWSDCNHTALETECGQFSKTCPINVRFGPPITERGGMIGATGGTGGRANDQRRCGYMTQHAQDHADLAALVKAAQAGNEAALARLLHSGLYIIHATVHNRVPVGDAEDVMQEVRLAVWETLPALNEPGSFTAWLRTIASRRIADHHKASDEAVPVGLIRDDEQGAQEALEEIENWAVIEELLAELSPRHQVVLLLRAVDELPFAEVGGQMDISEEAARKLFRRAKLKIFHAASGFGPKTPT